MHRLSLLPLALLAACVPPRAAPPADSRFDVAPESRGALDPAVIQATVRQSFGHFRRCYEDGVARSPQLRGRVVVRFMIGVNGQVTRATDAGSDLPDPEVIRCVVRRFMPIAFPAPEGGVIVVVYPLSFAPDGVPSAAPSSAPAAASSSAPAPVAPAALPARPAPTSSEPLSSTAGGAPDPAAPLAGRLPPAEIQRIVRQSFGRFRRCYEDGLRRDANLQGRIAVRFVIGLEGQVTSVSDGGSDLPDPEVTRCVIDSFRGLVFPPPEGGIVTVVYPISFAPGG